MTERNNWTIFVIVLLGLSALSLPRTAPDGTRSQTLRESGTPPGRNQKAAGSAKQEVNGETLEKVEAELNERETALQKVAEYFGARDLFITEEDLKDVILGSSVAVADASELGKLLPPVRQRIALPRNLEVSSEGGPTYFVFRPEIDRRISGHYRIDASIITIPDPQNSHFAYMFDREIESIKRAAEQHGFLLDRFWFPWDTIEPGTEAKGSGSQKIERARRKQDEPGILLFRKNYDKHLFATFLVGETPTSGINKEAFARAVEYHARLCDADPQSDRDLRVVAPVYSGAYPSLELAIQECQRRYKEKDICVYNGSALNPDIPGRIGRLLPEADYHSFVIDSSILRARFAEYCHNALSIEEGGIAFLNEDSSFGTTTFANILKEPRNTPKGPWNSFTLPMHLSRIRAAYEREPGMGVLQHQTVQNLPRETL